MKSSITSVLLIAALLHISSLLPVCANETTEDAHFEATLMLLEQADTARAKGHLEKARRLYGSAISSYEELAQKYPDSHPELIQFRIAYCRNQISHLIQPASSAAKSETMPPPSRPLAAAVIQAISLCRAGEFERAENVLESFLEATPDDPVGLLMMGTAQLALGNSEIAKEILQKAVDSDPDFAEARYNLSQLIIRQSDPDFDEARLHYEKSVSLGIERDPQLEAVLGIE
jgi:tetratricopeptide (TPR) repeat protein